jgi:hypothetical protein
MSDTIREDVSQTGSGDLDIDGAANAFLERWKTGRPDEGPSESVEESGPETQHETAEVEADDGVEPQDDQEEAPEEPQVPAKKIADADAVVVVKIDGEDREVPVKDLTRLFGQEASLTRKSQEIAAERRKLEEGASTRYDEALNELVARAEAKLKPYQDLDFFVLSKTLSAEDLTSLRKDMKEFEQDVAFLRDKRQTRSQERDNEKLQRLHKEAQETVKKLTDKDSPYHISGWSDETYNDLRAFAVQQGVGQQDIDEEVSPAVIKLIWKARQFDKAQEEAKKVQRKVIPTTPKRVATPNAGSDAPTADSGRKAMSRLKESGSIDDAAEVFLQRWKTAR